MFTIPGYLHLYRYLSLIASRVCRCNIEILASLTSVTEFYGCRHIACHRINSE